MQIEGFVPNWRALDVDTESLWRESGCSSLTQADVDVPHQVVREVAGLVKYLDDNGAHLAETYGHGGLGVLSKRGELLGYSRSGTTSCNGTSHLMACEDGSIALTLSRDDDFSLIPAWLESDIGSDALDDIRTHLRNRSALEMATRAGELGLACFAVGEVSDGVAVKATRVGDCEPSDLHGLWTANLASLWAGPLAANTVSWMGSGVMTIESESRPDGARQTPEFYKTLHQIEELIVLPFTSPRGQFELKQILNACDVVIEGSRPRALRQLGIDADVMAQLGPRIWVSITAAGRDEHNEHRIGYGDDAAAGGGLVGWTQGQPVFLGDAIADPLTGLTVAATIHQLAARGGRWMVDIALARVARSVVA